MCVLCIYVYIIGAGGTARSAGVGILLHKRWVRGFKGFKRVLERLCALDLNISKRKLRFILPFMPTTWHEDAMVEGVYTELSKLCEEAYRLQRVVVVAGDFNAVVGRRSLDDPHDLIGDHGFGDRNDRGQQTVDWASAEGLITTNTRFRKPLGKQWTHCFFGHGRIIDYSCRKAALAGGQECRSDARHQRWHRPSLRSPGFANRNGKSPEEASP